MFLFPPGNNREFNYSGVQNLQTLSFIFSKMIAKPTLAAAAERIVTHRASASLTMRSQCITPEGERKVG